MTARWISVWRRFLGESVRSSSRRRLVPNRFSGPKAVSVHYRVEDVSRSLKIAQRLLQQPPFTVLTRYLPRTASATMSDSDPARSPIIPPAEVRGMKTLDKALFTRTVPVPALTVPAKNIGVLTKTLRVSLLKMVRVKPVAELSPSDPLHKSHRLFLMDPTKFHSVDDFSAKERATLAEFGVSVDDLCDYDLQVGYENWGVAEILRAVLPESSDGVSGFSIIGHIAHLNLKADILDYKYLIGQVIMDKNSSVRTVVNKVNTIDNTFRNFQMELLAGEDNFVTRAKENGCVFEMDFSKVYWNPRLSTEHERVVSMLKPGSVLYDVFAGVGPFAVPAAKRGLTVLANDLNPHSHSSLCANVKLNKVKEGKLRAFNMDGREFIVSVVKPDLTARLMAVAARCQGPSHAASTTATATGMSSEQAPTTQANDDSSKSVADREASSDVQNVSSAEADSESSRTVMTDTQAENNTSSLQSTGAFNASTENNSDHINSATSTTEQQQLTPSVSHKVTTTQSNIHKNNASASTTPATSTTATTAAEELYVTMNLPAMALEFLDAFCGLLADFPEDLKEHPLVMRALPTVICYCFEHKKQVEGNVRSRAEEVMGCGLPADASVRCVRNVAPGKEMMCLQFKLTPKLLFGPVGKIGDGGVCEGDQAEGDQPPSKRQKMSAETV